MLNDPQSVTYNGTPVSLPRVGGFKPAAVKREVTSCFRSQSGEFSLYVRKAQLIDDVQRVEITLERLPQDADGDPFTGNWRPLPNRVGLVFEVNSLKYATSTDIDLLRTALLTLVDSTLQGKLINGQM